MRFLLLPLLFSSLSLGAQHQSVDIIVRKLDLHTTNTKKLSEGLTTPFKTKEEKVRAIYFWIGSNIEYDWHLYRNKKLQNKLAEKKLSKRIKRTLKTRKAICGGYSELFRVLAHASDIECEVVDGFSKTKTSDIGRKKKVDHAWNAVRINGDWKLFDVTWGRGHILYPTLTGGNIEDPYFDANPEKFNFNHLPTEDFWRLNSFGITKEEFRNFPIVYTGFFAEGFELCEKSKQGIIDLSLDEPMLVTFTATRRPLRSRVRLGKEFFDGTTTENDDGTFTFRFIFPKIGNYYADVYFDGMPTLSYLVRVKRTHANNR